MAPSFAGVNDSRAGGLPSRRRGVLGRMCLGARASCATLPHFRSKTRHQGAVMNWALSFLRSSIGLKVVMAFSGVILFGFVVVHMLGNLQVYMGPTLLDEYGHWLRTLGHGGALWVARGVLLVAAIAHVWSAWCLTRLNQEARPQGYRERVNLESTVASRTMRWSGLVVLIFIVYHLLHFTIGTVHPDFIEGKVTHNFITGFQ